MLFSVIIPVYNARLTLDQCIRSVLSQETQDLEVCIVDDGSTDGSDSICDTWARTDSRIKVHHQSNKGVSSARNKGLEMATGDWITFLDSDDTIEGAYFPINPNDDIYDLYIQNGNVSIDGRTVSSATYGNDYYTGKAYLFAINNNGHLSTTVYNKNRIYNR